MLHTQRPSAPPLPVLAAAAPVVARPHPAREPATPSRSAQSLNARGQLMLAGKVRSPVA